MPKSCMNTTKEALIAFLDENVFVPAESHPQATEKIKRKVRFTRIRLTKLWTPEEVEQFFWNAMASDSGIDSYTKIKSIGTKTFEDVRVAFKQMCGRA